MTLNATGDHINTSGKVSRSATTGTAFLSTAQAAAANVTEEAEDSAENATAEEADAGDESDSKDDSADEEEKVSTAAKGAQKSTSKMQTRGESNEEKRMSRAKAAALDKVDKATAQVKFWETKVKRTELRQETVAEQKEYMADEQGFKTDMAKRVTLVANETQTKALSEFLGGMWTEMRKFSAPFFKQHLEDEGKEIKVELKKNEAKLADAKEVEDEAKKELQQLIEKEKEMMGVKKEDKEEKEEKKEGEKEDEKRKKAEVKEEKEEKS